MSTLQGEGAFRMTEPRDSFARKAVHALRQDMEALWTRVGVVEKKTATIARIGTCGLCGEPAKGRYCEQCLPYWEGE